MIKVIFGDNVYINQVSYGKFGPRLSYAATY